MVGTAIAFFATFCGAERWARRMASSRPIRRVSDLMEAAAQAFEAMRPADWLEAFNHHPKIGDVDCATELDGGDGWSSNEQAQVRIGAKETLDTLTEENKKYEEKFEAVSVFNPAQVGQITLRLRRVAPTATAR